jgi:hypothetical protein
VGKTLANTFRWLKIKGTKIETILHIFAGNRHSKPRNLDPDPNLFKKQFRIRIKRSGSTTMNDFLPLSKS